MTNWTRQYLKDYLAYCYTLFASVIAGTAFIISGYQRLAADKSMLKKLYGIKDTPTDNRASIEAEEQQHKDSPRAKFRESLEERKEFRVKYCCFRLITLFKALCCCLVPYCGRSTQAGMCRRQLDSQTKFLVAQKRLQKEQDIQYLIEMNRVSRLLHKARFMPRQRRAIAFFQRYIISEKDLDQQEGLDRQRATTILTDDPYLDELMSGFDPRNDLFDRRLYFEVTGNSLIPGEFLDNDSSMEEGYAQKGGGNEDPLHWVFSQMEGKDDDYGYEESSDRLLPGTQTIN